MEQKMCMYERLWKHIAVAQQQCISILTVIQLVFTCVALVNSEKLYSSQLYINKPSASLQSMTMCSSTFVDGAHSSSHSPGAPLMIFFSVTMSPDAQSWCLPCSQ